MKIKNILSKNKEVGIVCDISGPISKYGDNVSIKNKKSICHFIKGWKLSALIIMVLALIMKITDVK